MTNQIAIGLGLLLSAAILGDIVLNEGQALIFTGKKFADLLLYLAFWR